jgi:prephenate dehydrogenase
MTMKTTIRDPHNFVPERFEPSIIAIVGGKGSMGRRLAEEFFKEGYQVRLTGEEPLAEIGPTLPKDWKRAVRRWNENVCKDADVVVFSVPIPLLSKPDGLSCIFGHTPPRGWRNKLVIDTSTARTGQCGAYDGSKSGNL